jgi:hypothetical protein
MYDEFNLQIGDTYFMIPPEFIQVHSASTTENIVTLRQENTQKLKAGYHKRTIFIDIVFNGIEQLNGYKVEGPEVANNEGYYYVDGLRQLLAQFKCTPFLPIQNEYLKLTVTSDVFGVEMYGAIKNVIAIAGGIIDGMGYPESTKCMFITKSLNDTISNKFIKISLLKKSLSSP